MLGWNSSIGETFLKCGSEVYIGHNVLINNPELVSLGNRVRIDPFCYITTGLETKDNVHICAGVMMIGGCTQKVIIGNWSFIAYGSKLICGADDPSGNFGPVNGQWGNNRQIMGDIVFNDFSGVFSDVILSPGVILPEGCVIGAKSIVLKKDISRLTEWSIWAGRPLRKIANRNRFAKEIVAEANFLKRK